MRSIFGWVSSVRSPSTKLGLDADLTEIATSPILRTVVHSIVLHPKHNFPFYRECPDLPHLCVLLWKRELHAVFHVQLRGEKRDQRLFVFP